MKVFVKLLIFTLIIIVLVIVANGLYNNDRNVVTLSEIQQLMLKKNGYKNYKLTYKTPSADLIVEEFFKDEIYSIYNIDEEGRRLVTWASLREGISIYINDNAKIVDQYYIDEYGPDVLGIEPMQIIKMVIGNAKDYKFLGEEIFKNQKCYVIEFKANLNNSMYKVWISIDTGNVLKYELYEMTDGKNYSKINTIEADYEYNIVTDEDIKRPNKDDYLDYEYNEIVQKYL